MEHEVRQSSMDSSARDRTRTLTLTGRPSSMHVDILYGHTVSPIIEGSLYLSDQQAPLDIELLNFLGITHIVNASNEAVPNKFPEYFKYCNVNVLDDNADDIFPHFEIVCNFLVDHPAQSVAADSMKGISGSSDDVVAFTTLSDVVEALAEEAVLAALGNVGRALSAMSTEANGLQSDRDNTAGPIAPNAAAALVELSSNTSIMEDKETIAMGSNTLHTQQEYFQEKVVLFHCWMGISRSASLLIAYLVKNKAMTLKDAFSMVKKKRPKIQPTPVFAQALAKYELFLHPEFAANTISIKQMCGGAVPMSSMRISSKKIDPANPDDDGTGSVNTTPNSIKPPTSLMPINEQQNSSSVADNSNSLMKESPNSSSSSSSCCSCCIIM